MILDDDSRGSAVKTGDVHGPAGTVAAPILPTRTVAADDPHITVDGPVLAMPTGPVLPASSPARTILQAVVILAAALARPACRACFEYPA